MNKKPTNHTATMNPTALNAITERAEQSFDYLIDTPNAKMGGIRTLHITTDDGTPISTITRDERKFYKGRGAKYNNSIKHENIENTVTVSEIHRIYRQKIAPLLVEQRDHNDPTWLSNYAKSLINPNQDDTIADCYRGAGDYLIAIKDRKITATVYGHYEETKPQHTRALGDWYNALRDELSAYGDIILGEGSGTCFFAVNPTDLIETKTYTVPSADGYQHQNIEIIF